MIRITTNESDKSTERALFDEKQYNGHECVKIKSTVWYSYKNYFDISMDAYILFP